MMEVTLICAVVFCVNVAGIKVPPSWEELPYHAVVDGLPTNPKAYYPQNTVGLSDQIVQNDETIKLFHELNPSLTVLHPQVQPNFAILTRHPSSNNKVQKFSNSEESHDEPHRKTLNEEERSGHHKQNRGQTNEDEEERRKKYSSNEEIVSPKLKAHHERNQGRQVTYRPRDEDIDDSNEENDKKTSSSNEETVSSKLKTKKKKKKSKKKTNYEDSPQESYISYHEDPGEVPTKPIYPGEGQWVRKGTKHQPHITRHKFAEPVQKEESNPGLDFFNNQKHKFEKEYEDFPRQHNLQQPDESSKDEENEFVPYRTYAQVRRTESRKKMRRPKKEDPRLRESIRDSKVHTVYSEEGYEDSAYDHGDQEKHAESTEGTVNKKKKTEKQNRHKIDESEEEVEPPPEPSPPEDNEDENGENQKEEESENREEKEVKEKEETEAAAEEEEDEQETEKKENVEETEDEINETSNRKDKAQKNKKSQEKEYKSSFHLPPNFDEYYQKTRNLPDHNAFEYEDDEIIIKFNHSEPDPAPDTKNEETLIDSVMEETKFGEKIKIRARNRRSVDSKDKNEKYPYYNAENVDAQATLRYAENLKNIPRKVKGKMSFYDAADENECPEVSDIDPVPERIKNAQNITESNNGTIAENSPKLNKLGDQIDCLKARYFGEDPFDNPLFQEESIESPRSIFKENANDIKTESTEEEYDYEFEVDNTTRSGKDLNQTGELLPEALPYVVRRIYRRPPPLKHFKRSRPYSKRTQQPRPQTYRPSTSTQKISTDRISEVHYKDEIKPSEQMNVFADIINNIKNSSRDAHAGSSEVKPVTIKVNIMRPTKYSSRYKSRSSTTVLPTEDEDGEDVLNKYQYPSIYQEPNVYNAVSTDSSKKRKRKRRPVHTTSNEIFEPTTEYVKTKKRRKEYTNNEIHNSIRPEYGFKPVYENIEDNSYVQVNHKPEYQDIGVTTVNKFYVIGMRPPPEKPYTHPNYRLNQVKKRRTSPVRKRRVRRNTRKGYAAIQRGGKQNEEQKIEEEVDDYVPHRPKNFHYDVESGKIIYDKKTKTAEDFEYIEIDEPEEPAEPAPTHPPPKKKEPPRIWPKKYPDGPNYLDFIKILKENPNYVFIPDPKSTEKPEEASTVLTTSKPTLSTGIPEFLAILNKVRGDKNYKFIEDTTLKPKTTTSTEEEAEVVEDYSIEESRLEDVQNLPGVQGILDTNSELQIFDITDFLPKTKNYKPRTSIDTSKYASIRRTPNTRHKISSKYNSEENDENAEGDTEAPSTTTTESFTIDIPTSSMPSTTPFRTTERITSPTKSRRVLLSRRRGSPVSTAASAESATTATAARRQRGRGRFRSTTTTSTEAPKTEGTRNRRNLQRGNYSNLVVPKNHKPEYRETRKVSEIKPTPRSVTLNIIKQINVSKPEINATTQTPKIENVTNKTSDDIEVFKKIDKDNKHGGNYKYKKVEIKIIRNYKPSDKELDESKDQLSDIVQKPYAYYSDSELPLHINRLKEKNIELSELSIEENDGSSKEREDFFDDVDVVHTRKSKHAPPIFIKDPSKRLYYYAPI